MDKLSNLIQEAKPLYRQRKRNKAVAKLVVLTAMPVMLLTGAMHMYTQGCDIYLSLENNYLQTELLQDDYELLR